MRRKIIWLGVALALAACAGAEWQVETVAEAGYNPGIFPQKNGALCIIYSVPNHPGWWESRYVRKGERLQVDRPAKKWGEDDPFGHNLSKCLDEGGRVHFSFYDADSAEIKYACWTGKRWDVATLAPGNELQSYSAVAVDSKGQPYIVYACKGVKYARRDGKKWLHEDVAEHGKYPAIAVDRTGGVHIAFYDDADAEVKYSRRTKNGWKTENVYTGVWFDDDINLSLAVDESGRPHLSFIDGCFGDLKYAFRDGSQWIVETVDRRGWVGERSAMVLGDRGEPFITYHAEGGLRTARKVNGVWSTVPVLDFREKDRWDVVGFSAALDGLGRPCVIYSYGAVKLATWVGSDWPEKADEAPMVFEDRSEGVSLVKWYPAALAVTRDYPWRKKGGWDLRAAPDYGADEIGSIGQDQDFRITDGVSIFKRGENWWREEEALYETWLKVKGGGLEGWVEPPGFPVPSGVWPSEPAGDEGGPSAGYYYAGCPALVFFGADFAPLREGPSYERPVVKEEEASKDEVWLLSPEIEAGSIYDVVARCRDWLCVGVEGNGAWLPAATPGLELYYPAFTWEYDPELLGFEYYFPLGDDVARALFAYGAYFKMGRIPMEDPELIVVADGREFKADITYHGTMLFFESGAGYFTANFPRGINRREIESVTFAVGVEPYRVGFTVDPRLAWAEYDAQK